MHAICTRTEHCTQRHSALHALLFTRATTELWGHCGSLSPQPCSPYYTMMVVHTLVQEKVATQDVPNELCFHNSIVLLDWDQLNSSSASVVKLKRSTIPSMGVNAEKVGLPKRADRKLKMDKNLTIVMRTSVGFL